MKLSELVRYRNNLDTITPRDIESQITAEIDPIIHTVKMLEMPMPDLFQKLTGDRENILSAMKDFRISLESVKQETDRNIEIMEPAYLANSYRLYQIMQDDSTEYILNRRLGLSQQATDYIQSRVQMQSDWRQTGAVLRPGLETWMDHMIACDPLYLIDTRHDLFEPVKSRFNEAYVNRLRFYKIEESDKPGMLSDLPNGQFGFVLAYNFFHYTPFEVLKNYLVEIYDKLDQGGCLAFTFNDCSRWGAVDLAERWFMCYTPGRLVQSLCENLGYEIVNSHVIDNAITWLEIVKPGKHVSIKGGQTLAKIIEKSK